MNGVKEEEREGLQRIHKGRGTKGTDSAQRKKNQGKNPREKPEKKRKEKKSNRTQKGTNSRIL